MLNLKLNLKYTGVEQKSIMKYKEKVEQIHQELHKRANDEKDFVGWLELPTNYDKEEFERIKASAKRIQEDSEVYHPLSGRTFASAGWTGTQVTVDPLNDIFYTLLSNRSCNRMTFIDASKKELVKTDDSGRKSIILPNGQEMIDATRYAWDRDAALVHPAIELAIQYKFLEKIYEDEEKELINEHQTKRII